MPCALHDDMACPVHAPGEVALPHRDIVDLCPYGSDSSLLRNKLTGEQIIRPSGQTLFFDAGGSGYVENANGETGWINKLLTAAAFSRGDQVVIKYRKPDAVDPKGYILCAMLLEEWAERRAKEYIL